MTDLTEPATAPRSKWRRAARWSRSRRPAWSPWRRSPGPGGLAEPGAGGRNRGGAGPAGVHPVLAARQGARPGREPPGHRAPVPRPGHAERPGRCRAAAPRPRLCLTVACGPGPRPVRSPWMSRPAWPSPGRTAPRPGRCEYSLTERGYARWDLAVAALPGTAAGAVLRGRAHHRRPRPGAGGHGADHRRRAARAPARACRASNGTLRWSPTGRAGSRDGGCAWRPPSWSVAPGECATLTVRLANRTASVIRGESQLMSPFGTWHAGSDRGPAGSPPGPARPSPWTTPWRCPPGARPGSHWWALAKVMYFGRVRYTECARIQVGVASPLPRRAAPAGRGPSRPSPPA